MSDNVVRFTLRGEQHNIAEFWNRLQREASFKDFEAEGSPLHYRDSRGVLLMKQTYRIRH